MVKNRPRNVLAMKRRRDMRRALMQFISIIALCTLGTFAFSALDGTARMTRATIDRYFEENNLADLWINMPFVTRTELQKLSGIPGVQAVRARSQFELESDLGEDVRIAVTAFDGPMDINMPLLREGSLLLESDKRGCLLEERFATAHSLHTGSRLVLKHEGQKYVFIVRGIVVSPEYIVVSDNVAAKPDTYGYILCNSLAVPQFPLTQVCATLSGNRNESDVVSDIEKAIPEALVISRAAHSSTVRITSDAVMFENMTLIFPILAYFIATLIVMTTLERMIDNQRLQMGTLEALGFSARRIRSHYLSYAVLPSLAGAVLGTLIGHYTLPPLLWRTLIGQNEMPYRVEPHISLPAWGMVALTVFISVTVCYLAYKKSARETPANLLRPKPPKSGQRILLERIPFLWRRFSFNSKMVLRNVLRNKVRSFMFFLGILFCTMLIITSFGLQDSVILLTENHYHKTLGYDVSATFEGTIDKAESYKKRIQADIVECQMVRQISVRFPAGSRTVTLNVIEDEQKLQNLGPDSTYLPLTSEGAAITRKLSKILKVKIGDVAEVWLPGETEALFIPVRQIVENNFSQGLYLTKTTWERLRKGSFIPTSVQIKGITPQGLATLESMEEIKTIQYPETQIQEMREMLDTLSSVFALLTFIALALAFVICYNMGLMNFVERIREYATLKVLGYHKWEIRSLILRENIILTLLGIVFGLYPGVLLTDAIMHSCEPEMSNYSGTPTLQSMFIAAVITFFFSVFLQLVLTRKVQKIDMVEALKSVE